MAETSRRVAAPVRKGGLPNALFVVASAEALPPVLEGIAELVTVTLPWGSLLRGALALDSTVTRGIASLLAPGGRVDMLLAPAARDSLATSVDVNARIAGSLEADWRVLGLEVAEARPATAGERAERDTTWARRLGLTSRASGAPADRVAWRLVLERRP